MLCERPDSADRFVRVPLRHRGVSGREHYWQSTNQSNQYIRNSHILQPPSAGNVDGHFVLGDIVLANTESAPSLYGLAEFSGYLTVGDSILFRCSSNGYGGNKCATSESRERERETEGRKDTPENIHVKHHLHPSLHSTLGKRSRCHLRYGMSCVLWKFILPEWVDGFKHQHDVCRSDY